MITRIQGKWRDHLSRFSQRLNQMASYVCYLLLGIITCVTVLQVALRYIFNSPTSWSEEIALLCLVWFGLIAVAIGIERHEHIAIRFIRDFLPKPLGHILDIFAQVLMAIFMFVILLNGVNLSSMIGEQVLPASHISKSFLYVPLFVSGALGLFNALGNLLLGRLNEIIEEDYND
ncbi:MAG: hypothetical protein COB49_11325 [Alphaproteobacteria bacterium]|nr:MAG: hypothetical protein COB49_11325 [Alphaproteobacteria bacterium]